MGDEMSTQGILPLRLRSCIHWREPAGRAEIDDDRLRHAANPSECAVV